MAADPPRPIPPGDEKTIVEGVLRAAFEKGDTFHQTARAFRNRLVIMTLIALVGAVCLVLLQWRLPDAGIVARPTDAVTVSRWAILMLVMVFGSIGALLTSIPAIAVIPRVNSPFSFSIQTAVLKAVVGSLTAVVGVIVTGSAGVTSGYANIEALVGVAVVFGAGQQAVTQFLDKRAGQLVDKLPT
jgi:hypothetical protein